MVNFFHKQNSNQPQYVWFVHGKLDFGQCGWQLNYQEEMWLTYDEQYRD